MKRHSMMKRRMAMMTLAMLVLAGCLLPAACTTESDAPETTTDHREVPLAIGEVSLSANLTDEGELARGGLTRATNPIDNLRLLYTFTADAGTSVRNNTLYKLNRANWEVATGSPILVDGRAGTAVGIYYTGTAPENLAVSEQGAIKLEMQPYTSGKSNLWYFQRHTDVKNTKATLDFNNLQCQYSMFRVAIVVDDTYPGGKRMVQKIVMKYGTGLLVSADYNPFSQQSTNQIYRESYTVDNLDLYITKMSGKPDFNINPKLNFFLPSQAQSSAALTVILNVDGKDYTATVNNFAGFESGKRHTLRVTLKGTTLVVGRVDIDDWTVGYSGNIKIE